MSYNLAAGDYQQGDFIDQRDNYDTGRLEYQNRARLVLTSITVGPASVEAAVPEPGTWALMIGGFGMVGMALRRRHTLTV